MITESVSESAPPLEVGDRTLLTFTQGVPRRRIAVRDAAVCERCGRPVVLWRRAGHPHVDAVRCARVDRSTCGQIASAIHAGQRAEAAWRAARCPWPQKRKMTEPRAREIVRNYRDRDVRSTANAYECPAGHWHVGRPCPVPPLIHLDTQTLHPRWVEVYCEWCWQAVTVEVDAAADPAALGPVFCTKWHRTQMHYWTRRAPKGLL